MKLVRKGVNYIYNVQPDSAQLYIDLVEKKLPNHPVVPMMKAISVLWSNIPVVTVDSVFSEFSGYLQQTIKLSARLDGGRQEDPEAIFFEMSARGLLAEYYADDGHYMKALSEASQAYTLVKEGFKLSDEVPEFLLTTGIYNYFREKYPEKHPIYKPLLWFFRSGDIELGLQQIRAATRKAVLSKVEAYVYLAYIYLRYENEPRKAQEFLFELNKLYPRNPYIQTKLLESLIVGDDFLKASLPMIEKLAKTDRPYYKMAGESFWGLYLERVQKDSNSALDHYQKSIEAGRLILDHGGYYRSLSYLGLGRIYAKKNQKGQAIYYLDMAIEYAEKDDIKEEVNKLLDQLE